MARVLKIGAAAVAAAVGYGGWVRPRLLRWGATADEVARTYLGDELIPDHDSSVFTMATTLSAPPEEVWPWLAQMGGTRAGFYSWDRLDHGGQPSANRIVPEWQDIHVGEHLANDSDGANVMTVIAVEPRRTLVLRTNMEFPSRRSFDPSGPLPRVYMDGVWSFHLSPAGDGGTRLVARTLGRTHPRLLLRPITLMLGDPMHFAMQVRQFQNLRSRVNHAAQRPGPAA